MFPSLDENKPFQSFEAATAHAKITALVRIVSIVSSFLFWLVVSLVLAAVYIYLQLELPPLAVLSVLGVAPFPLAAATWKIIEKLLCLYCENYVRSYVSIQS